MPPSAPFDNAKAGANALSAYAMPSARQRASSAGIRSRKSRQSCVEAGDQATSANAAMRGNSACCTRAKVGMYSAHRLACTPKNALRLRHRDALRYRIVVVNVLQRFHVRTAGRLVVQTGLVMVEIQRGRRGHHHVV